MDLIESIKADLGLNDSSYMENDNDNQSSLEKEALSTQVFEDPLAQEISSYLLETETEDEYLINSVSDSFDFIDKQAGEEIVPEDFRQFVLQAEVAGFDRSEIEDFVEKQAGLLGPSKFQSLLKNVKGQKAMLNNLTPDFHGLIANEAKVLNKKPGLLSRVREVFDPGFATANRAAKEQALVNKINELGASNAGMSSPAYTSGVLQKYLGDKPETLALKKLYTTPKVPPIPSVNTVGMNPSQLFAHTAANKMLEFKRSKAFKPSMYGLGGLGAGGLMMGGGSGNNDGSGKRVIIA